MASAPRRVAVCGIFGRGAGSRKRAGKRHILACLDCGRWAGRDGGIPCRAILCRMVQDKPPLTDRQYSWRTVRRVNPSRRYRNVRNRYRVPPYAQGRYCPASGRGLVHGLHGMALLRFASPGALGAFCCVHGIGRSRVDGYGSGLWLVWLRGGRREQPGRLQQGAVLWRKRTNLVVEAGPGETTLRHG